MTHDFGWFDGSLENPCRLSVHIHWTFLAIYYGSRVMKCVQLGCFHRGSISLHSYFTWTRSSLINHSWLTKLETLGYPMEKTTPLCVPSFWHNTGVSRTDGYAVAYTALAKLALLSTVNKASFSAVKSSPILDHERWARSWSQFLGSQPTGDLVLNLVVGCRYFPPGPWLLSQPKRSPPPPVCRYQIILLVTEAQRFK